MNERIVVVDDEPSVHEVVSAYLERSGYIVHCAHDGREGLALAESKQPALIVLDLMLLDLSGEELCAGAQPLRHTDPDAGREVGPRAADPRPRAWGRRLPHEALQPARAARAGQGAAAAHAGAEAPLVDQLSFNEGRLRDDVERRLVTVAGDAVELTPSEYKLLVALARFAAASTRASS